MSLQKAATILNVLQQNVATLAVALESTSGDVHKASGFVQNVLAKQGWPTEETDALLPTLMYLAAAIQSP